jgi:hypothetical protein
LTSAATFTVCGDEVHPFTILVTAIVNVPVPPIVGVLTEVLLIVPVAGAVHVKVVFGLELLVALTVVLGLPQVVVTEVALKLKVGAVVLVGTATLVVPVTPEQPVMVFVIVTV